MAVHAPRHGQWSHLPHLCHLIDATVARLTPHALVDMDRVIEVHEVGELRDTLPCNRFVRRDTLSDRSEKHTRHPERCMTRHTLLSRRKSGPRAPIGTGMAVPTVDMERTRMKAMIERDGLRYVCMLATRPGGPHPKHGERGRGNEYRYCRHQRPPRNCSSARREERRHQLNERLLQRQRAIQLRVTLGPHTSRRNVSFGALVVTKLNTLGR